MRTDRAGFLEEMAGRGDGIVRSHLRIKHPTWLEFGERLDAIERVSPYVTADIAREPIASPYEEKTDVWGCRWRHPPFDASAVCIESALADWSDQEGYKCPDPCDFTDWEEAADDVRRDRERGMTVVRSMDHGFIYLRLTYLRGFENFMIDVAEDRAELHQLASLVGAYWLQIARRWVALGVDRLDFGDDLGFQDRLPITPEAWRKYIKPVYERILSYCRENGVHVFLHTDGYIVDIIPDLIECGVSILNPQELVNGVDTLQRLAKGKVHIALDIDRQTLTPFGTPEEIDAHVLACIEALGSPNGGLSLVWGVWPPTPFENIEACVNAMAKYATHWVEKG